MTRKVWAIISVVILALLGSTTSRAEDKRRLLAELQAELATVQGQEVDLKASQSRLEQRMKDLDDQAEALKPRIEQWKAASSRSADEAARYSQAVATHNGHCAGTFTDPVFVNQCNNRKRDLDAWQSAASQRQALVESQRTELASHLESIRARYQEVQARHDENAATLRSLGDKRAVLRQTIDRLHVDDSFLKDLRARDRISHWCLGLTNVESQVECMKQVFDGAH
jgi:chromosome segregation ATPase